MCVCGDADQVHSLTVSTTQSRQRRPLLSWTFKPNGGIHAQLKRIDRSSGCRMDFCGKCDACVAARGWWGGFDPDKVACGAVSMIFLHMRRAVTVRGRSILCAFRAVCGACPSSAEGRLFARIRRCATALAPLCARPRPFFPASSHRPNANK